MAVRRYSQIVHDKIKTSFKDNRDKIYQFAEQIKLKERRIKKLINSKSDRELIQMLKEPIKAHIFAQGQTFNIICKAYEHHDREQRKLQEPEVKEQDIKNGERRHNEQIYPYFYWTDEIGR